MSKLFNPHDKFFKDVWSRREVARDFLVQYLPVELAEALDLDSVELGKDSFVDESLNEHFSDLLYKISTKAGMPAYVYMLLEHKSYPDRLVAFHLLRYMVKIWDLGLKQQKYEQGFPPIIPVVLYHGESEWKVAENFSALIVGSEALDSYIPDFRYLLYDISHRDDAALRGDVTLKVSLLLFKYIFRDDLGEHLPEILGLLKELSTKRTGLEFLETVLRYLSGGTDKIDEENLRRAVESALPYEGGKLMPTIAERWVQKGMEKGIEQGIEQGMERGKLEGLLEAVELGLSLKFGASGLSLMPSIRSVKNIALLEAVKEAIKVANNLSDVETVFRTTHKL